MSTVQIALAATTRIVQAVLRSTDEQSLLEEACRIIVDVGYRFSWVGEAEQNEEKKVRPTAWAGHEDGYLSAINISWGDVPHGRGPTGTAIRTGKNEAAEFSIWLGEASKRGYRSCCALPLMDGEKAFGALSITSGQAGAFGEQEMQLLRNLAEVLAFGIMNLRGRQRAEATIQQREEQLRQAVKVSKLGIFDHDHLSGRIYASEEHQRIYGVGPDEAFNVSLLLSRMYPGDRELISKAIERAHDPAGDGLYEVEHRVVRPDGSIRWLTTRAQTFFEGEKSARRAVRTIGAVADITERRQAEEALRQREEQLRQAVQVSQLGVFDHDHRTDSVYCSPETRKLFGLGPDERFTLPVVMNRIHPEDREKTLNIIKAAHVPGGGGTHEMEYRVVRPDGSLRWATIHAQTYFEGEGSERRAVRTVGAAADITERRQAEEKYRAIFDHAVVGIFQTTPEGRYLSVNPALARMWGFDSPQEMITTVSDIGRQEYVVPGQREEFKRLIEERGVVSDYEYEFHRKDGSRGWTRVNARVVRDARGKTLYYEGTDQDITEQKRAIDALRESEKRLSEAQRIARLGNWDWNVVTNSLYWSDEIYRIFGVQPQEFGATYETFLSYVHPDDREFVNRSVQEAFEGKTTYNIEHRILRGDGTERVVHERAEVFRDGSGKAVRMAGTVQDITEQRQADKALREAEEKYREIVDQAVVGIFQSTPDGRYLSVNQALARISGYNSPQEMIETISDSGRQEYADPERREEFKRLLDEHGVVRDFECEFYRKDGSRCWSLVNARAVRDAQGKTLYYEGTDQDITEQRRAIDAMRESEKRLSEAQRIARLGNWDWNVVTNSLYWSDEIYRIFGAPPQEFEASYETFLSFVHPEDRELVDRAVHEATQGKSSYDTEHRVIRRDGEVRNAHSQGEVFRDGSGKVVRMAGTLQDITESKKLEAQFKQAQKMEAVGRLAGGVAHDFNNLLSVIMGYTDLAEGLIASGKTIAVADKIAQIRRAAERGASLTKQLLAFSRRQMVHPRIVDLNKVVSSSADMLKRLIGEDVATSFKPEENLWMVKVDPGQIEQILMNLTVNARDAMPTGGRIVMETANITADEHYVSQHAPMNPGAYVMLSFADTGTGIAAENLPLIFEPFFTTKETGKGTGLGLATVYGIVKQNRGHIQAYSEPDKGTIFRIYFPREEGAETVQPSREPAAIRRGTETVLLVEDEAHLRGLIAALLEEGGYRVLLAESGAAALALAQDNKEAIDLLLTDVIMPGMSGVELCKRMQELRPGTRVLCMSGYTGDHLHPYGQFESEKTFLQKPFTNIELLKKLRAILDS